MIVTDLRSLAYVSVQLTYTYNQQELVSRSTPETAKGDRMVETKHAYILNKSVGKGITSHFLSLDWVEHEYHKYNKNNWFESEGKS